MSHNNHSSHGSHANHGNHGSHGNHANYGDVDYSEVHPNTGTPKTLTWSSWGDITDGELITDSTDKIKELRDKIAWLRDNHGKGTYTTAPDNPAVDLSSVADEEFDGVGIDYVEDIHYDTLKNSLDSLKTHLSGTGLGLTDKSDGDLIVNEDFQTLKAEIDNLASYDISAAYSNHQNHNDHDNHDNHGSHGNHGSYYN